MADTKQVLDQVRTSFRSEPRLAAHPDVALAYEDGTMTLEGEVANVAVKKKLLERAAAHPAVTGIIDRLRVAPAVRMGDKDIRDRVRDALLEEPAFRDLALEEMVKGEVVTLRQPPQNARGRIRISVDDGIVTLDGDAPSLAHKRLAGVLAWWVPGSRDVINGMEVVPDQPDSDEELAKAVHIVLEKDPFINADRVRVGAKQSVVTLEGDVPSAPQKEMAEFDAWYVFGVDKVVNRLEVRP